MVLDPPFEFLQVPGRPDEDRAAGRAGGWVGLYRDLLQAIAAHRVVDRPGRFESRVKKHRGNHYG